MNQNVLEGIKTKVLPVLKQAGIQKAALFGSYVRGEETKESDIDILVEYPRGLTLFDVANIKFQLEDALGKPVDLVGYNTIKLGLRHYILSEALPIL
jgi:predicted nucleotidyltransferase